MLTPDDVLRINEAKRLVARNGVWGTCVDCPRVMGHPYPEKCQHFKRADHKLTRQSLADMEERLNRPRIRWV